MFVRRRTAAALLTAAAVVFSLTIQAQVAPGGPPAVLVSRQLLASQHLHVGDVVSLSAETSGAHARPFRIAGVYEPTPDPMRLGQARIEARLHLPDLIDLAGQIGRAHV